jgi:plasmid stabilization system protein ParE
LTDRVPRTLSYTDKALTDLEAAETWLRQHGSGPAAWAKFDAIVSAIEGLRAHPCRWPLGLHSGVRERLCAGGWRAFYEVDPDTGRDETAGDVRVLRVYAPGQDRSRFIASTG